MGDIRQVLKANVKLYRKRRAWTQQQLAEACDVTTTYIGEIEIGRKSMSLSMIETVSKALNVEPWQLFLPAKIRASGLDEVLADELREAVTRAVNDVLKNAP